MLLFRRYLSNGNLKRQNQKRREKRWKDQIYEWKPFRNTIIRERMELIWCTILVYIPGILTKSNPHCSQEMTGYLSTNLPPPPFPSTFCFNFTLSLQKQYPGKFLSVSEICLLILSILFSEIGKGLFNYTVLGDFAHSENLSPMPFPYSFELLNFNSKLKWIRGERHSHGKDFHDSLGES